VSSARLRVISSLYTKLTAASSLSRKRMPIETACAPSARAATKPRPSAILQRRSPERARTASTMAGTTTESDVVPSTCPPASTPCAIIVSTPPSAAETASATEATWSLMSANSAVTVFRSPSIFSAVGVSAVRIWGWSGFLGATAGGAPRAAPHSPQNFSADSIAAPHRGHLAASGEPHWVQNFRPSRFQLRT
jgi:hypothetical protein